MPLKMNQLKVNSNDTWQGENMARTQLAIHLSLLNHALAKETKRALTIIYSHQSKKSQRSTLDNERDNYILIV